MTRPAKHSPTPSRAVRVANYCRVSTEEQRLEGHSIETQKALCREWCERHLADTRYEIVVFADEGYSGKLGWEPPKRGRRAYRPELARLTREIEDGRVDMVVVYRLDRLTRSVGVWARFVEAYLSDGTIRFVSLSESLDLDKTHGRLSANILASVASFMRDVIAENIVDAHRRRRLEGLPIGTHYGWRSVPPAAPGARPTIEPDPEQAPWVPRICEWFLRGWGMRRIAAELARQGAPLHPGAHTWTRASVGTILQNPLNAGYVALDDEFVTGQNHQQRLLDKDTFDAVQRELARRQKDGKVPVHGDLQPLYKIARCGACGQPVQVTRSQRTPGAHAYRCRGSELDYKATCRGWAKDTRLVDRVVLKQLAAFMDRPEFQKLVAEEARAEVLAGQVGELEAHRARLEHAIVRKEEEARRLLRVYTSGTVAPEAYDEEYRRIEGDRAALQLELGEITLRLSDEAQRLGLLAEVQRAVTELPALWEELNPEERRHLLREIIEYVLLEPLGMGRHRVRVKFHFLPEVVEELPNAKGRMTGLLDDVAHISNRELAYLALHADGWTDTQIKGHWQVTTQAVFYLRKSVARRLEVNSVDEAVRLVQGRIERERDKLPLGPSDWHGGRPRSEHLRPRALEALGRYAAGSSEEEIASAMGIKLNTVTCTLWEARHGLGCATLAEAAERYIELKGGQLPSPTQPLPL